MKECVLCSGKFKGKIRKNKSGVSREQKYCSFKCRLEGNKTKQVEYICSRSDCGKIFYDIETNSRKYCGRTCSAIDTNKSSPKRTKTKICKFEGCEEKILSSRSYCTRCYADNISIMSNLTKTIGELRGNQKYQTHSYLRNLARICYREYNKEFRCLECGYDLHVEICHVKDLYKYSDEDLVSDTVKEDNLVALCRNHHWEFDNGHLEICGVLKKSNP